MLDLSRSNLSRDERLSYKLRLRLPSTDFILLSQAVAEERNDASADEKRTINIDSLEEDV